MDLSYTDRSAVRPGLGSGFLILPVPGSPVSARFRVLSDSRHSSLSTANDISKHIEAHPGGFAGVGSVRVVFERSGRSSAGDFPIAMSGSPPGTAAP